MATVFIYSSGGTVEDTSLTAQIHVDMARTGSANLIRTWIGERAKESTSRPEYDYANCTVLEYGGFFFDDAAHFRDNIPTMRRPAAVELWRRAVPGDWVAVYSAASQGWLTPYDYLRFVRLALRFGLGLVFVRDQWLIPPQTVESELFEVMAQSMFQIFRTIKRGRARAKRLAEQQAQQNQPETAAREHRLPHAKSEMVSPNPPGVDTGRAQFSGTKFGVLKIALKLKETGLQWPEIRNFLLDMGYSNRLLSRKLLRTACLVKNVHRDQKKFTRFLILDGATTAEMALFETAAGLTNQTLEEWAFSVLGKAAHREVKRQQELDERLFKSERSQRRRFAAGKDKGVWERLAADHTAVDPRCLDGLPPKDESY